MIAQGEEALGLPSHWNEGNEAVPVFTGIAMIPEHSPKTEAGAVTPLTGNGTQG
jgi:hypothetical protein